MQTELNDEDGTFGRVLGDDIVRLPDNLPVDVAIDDSNAQTEDHLQSVLPAQSEHTEPTEDDLNQLPTNEEKLNHVPTQFENSEFMPRRSSRAPAKRHVHDASTGESVVPCK